MSEKTDDKSPDRTRDKPATSGGAKPDSDAPPVSGPNAPVAGNGDADAEGTDGNRKGGYGAG